MRFQPSKATSSGSHCTSTDVSRTDLNLSPSGSGRSRPGEQNRHNLSSGFILLDSSDSSISSLFRMSLMPIWLSQPHACLGMLMRWVKTIWLSPSSVCSMCSEFCISTGAAPPLRVEVHGAEGRRGHVDVVDVVEHHRLVRVGQREVLLGFRRRQRVPTVADDLLDQAGGRELEEQRHGDAAEEEEALHPHDDGLTLSKRLCRLFWDQMGVLRQVATDSPPDNTCVVGSLLRWFFPPQSRPQPKLTD
ncbi:hypothetical protein EYF80_055422 [Liparis tanakae]|uniref:Uncharacterized protein n=1 Tax=Liparis tanakae TaxID=230148 RepID=A0A4Z2F072_9TELE|nr:hypothetical protein EYF80_055422 [Liparis tanakae]